MRVAASPAFKLPRSFPSRWMPLKIGIQVDINTEFRGIACWVPEVCETTALPSTLPVDNREVHQGRK
jgi:hypothetical protein